MGGIKSYIYGKNGQQARVSEDGSLNCVIHPHPPKDEIEGPPLPFRQYFTDDGTSTGTTDMSVGVPADPVDYWINASDEYDIYINTISVQISDDGSPNLNKFGNITALTTGIEWIYFTRQEGEYTLHDGIKTNLDFIRLGAKTAGIGTGVDAFLADVSGGGTEKSYLPNIDISETFGMPWGIRLTKGSTDKLIWRLNDALNALSELNAIAYGIRF